MKFRVDIESEPTDGGRRCCSGKVWPRDEAEPKEWTITARDESPNLNASPGLYGNAKVAELYLDNVEVTANGQTKREAKPSARHLSNSPSLTPAND